MDDALKIARDNIERLDCEIARLFEKRMKEVASVAAYKASHGLKIFNPEREAELIRLGEKKVEDPTVREYYATFLKSVMDISKTYQERLISGMKVAYSGTEGAFAHIAASKLFPSARKISYPDFESAYRATESGECDAVVLPLENSYNGEVGQVSDLMMSGSLYITDQLELPVCQDLLTVTGATLADVSEVVSHPQALGQCAEFLKKHGFKLTEYANTALAAKYVAQKGDKSVAAIASGEAAELFGLQVLERNINESNTNTTRFAVMTRAESPRSETEKGVHSVILFTVRNEAGALAKAIEVIGKHGFNMRALRSRPMKELLWQYYFYVEAEGNLNTKEGEAMMSELKEYCDRLKAIGSFIKK